VVTILTSWPGGPAMQLIGTSGERIDRMEPREKMDAKKAVLEMIKYMSPVSYLLYMGAEKLLPFLDKQGEIKKADEEFITNIIKTARENGVDEFTLKLDKSQLTGLDTTIKKVKGEVGFDLDIGIKGETNIELHIKFKE
jgi:hypothetical protein